MQTALLWVLIAALLQQAAEWPKPVSCFEAPPSARHPADESLGLGSTDRQQDEAGKTHTAGYHLVYLGCYVHAMDATNRCTQQRGAVSASLLSVVRENSCQLPTTHWQQRLLRGRASPKHGFCICRCYQAAGWLGAACARVTAPIRSTHSWRCAGCRWRKAPPASSCAGQLHIPMGDGYVCVILRRQR
jgi:hypothetical protein